MLLGCVLGAAVRDPKKAFTATARRERPTVARSFAGAPAVVKGREWVLLAFEEDVACIMCACSSCILCRAFDRKKPVLDTFALDQHAQVMCKRANECFELPMAAIMMR